MKSSGTIFIILGVAVIAFTAAAQGCQFDEIIQTDVPRHVQKETGSPAKVSLKESKYVLEDYDRTYKAKFEKLNGEYESGRTQFAEEIEDAVYVQGIAESLTNDALSIAIPGVANLPGGAILSSLLVGAGGLLVGRRLPAKKVLDQAWEEGVDDAAKIKSK